MDFEHLSAMNNQQPACYANSSPSSCCSSRQSGTEDAADFLPAPTAPLSQAAANAVSLMQMNGRKVLGPPPNWHGPVPTAACELFVRRIPKDLNEQKLIQPFLRFGDIYEIRLPMDFNQENRGYAYIKYTNEEDAACAMEVMSHYFVTPKRKLEILHSYEKCRLFVSNIPKHLLESEIDAKLRMVFPTMERIYTRGGCSMRELQQKSLMAPTGEKIVDELPPQPLGNRGHVFVHFPSHMHALEAKKGTTPGVVRMWGRDLKVVWANTERDADLSKAVITKNNLHVYACNLQTV